MLENEESKKTEPATLENDESKKTELAIRQVSEQTSQPADRMTQEQFSAQMTELTERARAAGLRPIQAMITTYFKLGVTMLDKMLEGLEPENSPKKKVNSPADGPEKKE